MGPQGEEVHIQTTQSLSNTKWATIPHSTTITNNNNNKRTKNIRQDNIDNDDDEAMALSNVMGTSLLATSRISKKSLIELTSWHWNFLVFFRANV